MSARRRRTEPTGGVGSNQYQTVGTPTTRAGAGRVRSFAGAATAVVDEHPGWAVAVPGQRVHYVLDAAGVNRFGTIEAITPTALPVADADGAGWEPSEHLMQVIVYWDDADDPESITVNRNTGHPCMEPLQPGMDRYGRKTWCHWCGHEADDWDALQHHINGQHPLAGSGKAGDPALDPAAKFEMGECAHCGGPRPTTGGRLHRPGSECRSCGALEPGWS